jgi:hypothetical protein
MRFGIPVGLRAGIEQGGDNVPEGVAVLVVTCAGAPDKWRQLPQMLAIRPEALSWGNELDSQPSARGLMGFAW